MYFIILRVDLILLFSTFSGYTLAAEFLTAPEPIAYAECGGTLELPWTYDANQDFHKITWYLKTASDIKQNIADNDPSTGFQRSMDSTFPPVVDNRLSFLPNAGLRITNVKESDEAVVNIDADLIIPGGGGTFDVATGDADIKIYVVPSSVSPLLPNTDTADLADASKVFSCTANGRPEPTIKWYQNGIELVHDGSKYTITSTPTDQPSSTCSTTDVTSTLTISNIDATDAGEITCSAEVQTSEILYLNQTSTFNVNYAPGTVQPTSFNITPSDVDGGETVYMSCLADAYTAASYEIYQDGNLIHVGAPVAQGVTFTFNITNVQSYHEGNYSCKATNFMGSDTVYESLAVEVKPIITYLSHTLFEVDPTDPINITCIAEGDPLSSSDITWTKVQGPTSSVGEEKSETFQNSTLTEVRNDLDLQNADATMYGLYECKVENTLGNDTRQAWVYINTAPIVIDDNLPQPSITVAENDMHSFYCEVEGYPKPTITWLSNDVPIYTSAGNSTITESESNGIWTVKSTLNITLDSNHIGSFACDADTGQAKVNQTTNIIMEFTPQVTLVARDRANVNINSTKVFSALVGDTVILYCTVISQPAPDIVEGTWHVRWLKAEPDATSTDVTNIAKPNETMTTTAFSTTVTSWIEVEDITTGYNNDRYTCEATNTVGTGSDEITTYILDGNFTKYPTHPSCAGVGLDTTLDWQYEYTRPMDFIKWEKLSDVSTKTVDFPLGRIEQKNGDTTVHMNDARYHATDVSTAGVTITDVKVEDEGYYHVKINFQSTKNILTDTVYLEVVVPPHDTTITPSNPYGVEYENTSLTCTSIGKPPPSILWYKTYDYANPLIDDNTNYIIVNSTQETIGNETITTSILTILNTDANDLTNYTCESSTTCDALKEMDHVLLEVFYPPKNTNLTANQNPVLAGDSVILTCEASAYPMPIYYSIYLNDTLLHNSTNGTFIVNPVWNFHEGFYTCVPMNLVGIGENDTIFLEVNVAPVLLSHNDPVNGIQGEDATLTCTIYGDPQPEIYWRKLSGGSENDLGTTDTVTHQNSTLFVVQSDSQSTGLSTEDAGVYQCYGNNTYGYVEQNITLHVYYAVNITSHSLIQPLDNETQGDRVVHECIAKGYPAPLTIKWLLDGVEITKHVITSSTVASGVDYEIVKSVIVIENVDKDDRGVFECLAENIVGNDTESTVLDVYFPPLLTGNPNPTKHVNEKNSLTLSCVAQANELATIYWYKDGTQVVDGDGIHTITVDEQAAFDQITSTIRVNTVSLTTAGAYGCSAVNVLGMANATTEVEVCYRVEIYEHPPVTTTASEFERNYKLECKAIGNPRPSTIDWYREDELITFSNPDYQLVETTHNETTLESILIINAVSTSDYGNWTCLAKNTIAGNIETEDSETTLLSISYDPTFVIENPPSIYYVNETETIVMSCQVKSFPTPFVWWETPDGFVNDGRYSFATNTLESNSEYSIVEHQMTITDAKISDYNTFQCFGNNTIKAINTTAKLIVYYQDKPDSSQTLTLTENQDTLFLQTDTTSNPISNYTYYFNDTEIIPGADLQIREFVNSSTEIQVIQTGIIVDETIDAMNGGTYKIQACNVVGCKTDEWKVIVNYIPDVVDSLPPTTHVNVSDMVTLTCTYNTNPLASPLITWKKAGNTINNDADHVINEQVIHAGEFDNTVSSTLTLSGGIEIFEGGLYTCEATNSVRTSSSTTNLTVCHPPQYHTDLSPGQVTITEGTAVDLTVITYAYPQATYTWRKDDQTTTPDLTATNGDMSNPPTTDYFTHFQEATLSSSSALRTMSGKYNVTACNFLGCNESVTTTLVIHYPPTHQEIADQITIAGSSVNYTCIVDGHPAPTINWLKDGVTTIIDNGVDKHISTSSVPEDYKTTVTSVLTLNNVAKETDAGTYTCRAVNSVETVDEGGNLTIYYPPIETKPMSDIIIPVGSPINLLYGVQAFPNASFTFTHNDTAVDSNYQIASSITSQTEFDIFQDGTLHLPGDQVTRDVAGIYNATATNVYGSVSDTACVIVHYPPEIISNHSDTSIRIKGTDATLVCDVEAHPAADVKWYRNGVQVTPSLTSGMTVAQTTLYATKFDTTVRSTITFFDIQKDKSDNYTCVATNDIGTKSDRTHMIVHYPPIIVPDFVPTPFEKVEHTLQNLTCNVDSNPDSTISWLKWNGEQYVPINADVYISQKSVPIDEHEVIIDNSLLFLPNGIERSDAGKYSCKAANYLGSAQKYADVEVLFPPTFKEPGLMSGHQNVTLGNPTSIPCRVIGNPEPTIKWYKDNVEIPSSQYTTVVNSTNGDIVEKHSVLSFTATTKDDLATYTCEAVNSIDTTRQSKDLNVLYPPSTTSTNQTLVYNVGETYTLNCNSDANPLATNQWTNDGNALSTTSAAYTTTAQVTNDVYVSDYMCIPSNSLGQGSPVWYQVSVRVPPEINADAQCVQVVLSTGDSESQCSCGGTGYPTPDVYWTRLGSDTVISNSTLLKLPANTANDGAYQCHVRNVAGSATTAASVALYGELVGSWTTFSGCNNTCGSGHHFRSRICNNPPCLEDLIESQPCVGNCFPKPIPVMNYAENDDDWYILLFVLAPLLLVAGILAALWFARRRAKSDDPYIIPINESISHPPNMPQHIAPVGFANNGFVPAAAPDMESIEVNLLFEDDDVPFESETDYIDDPNQPSPPQSDNMPDDTQSMDSNFSNFYEELPLDHDFTDTTS